MSSLLPYAEVIGDPIAQSKSPLLHKYWLKELGIEGDFIRSRVAPSRLEEHLGKRRSDPHWRGCNLTIPHKENVLKFLDAVDESARTIGAVNCIVRQSGELFGTNTDIDGLGAALESTALEGTKVVLIGSGGASRAAVAYLAGRRIERLIVLVRDPDKAEPLRALAPGTCTEVAQLSAAQGAIEGAALIINATPMGMTGCDLMPEDLLAALTRQGSDITLFDMVYDPIDTRFLAAGREVGANIVDGLTMLVGQAVKAFEMFFDRVPPPADQLLRNLLTAGLQGSATT